MDNLSDTFSNDPVVYPKSNYIIINHLLTKQIFIPRIRLYTVRIYVKITSRELIKIIDSLSRSQKTILTETIDLRKY